MIFFPLYHIRHSCKARMDWPMRNEPMTPQPPPVLVNRIGVLVARHHRRSLSSQHMQLSLLCRSHSHSCSTSTRPRYCRSVPAGSRNTYVLHTEYIPARHMFDHVNDQDTTAARPVTTNGMNRILLPPYKMKCIEEIRTKSKYSCCEFGVHDAQANFRQCATILHLTRQR